MNKLSKMRTASRWRSLWVAVPNALFIATLRADPDVQASEGQTQNTTTKGKTFDAAALKNRGIDPKLIEQFAHAARFSEGLQPITLFVNGVRKGSTTALFDAQGKLCIDARLLQTAQLQMPESASAEQRASPGCDDFMSAYPNTVLELKPNTLEVYMVVPTQAMTATQQETGNFNSGGVAALLNYDLLGSRNESNGQTRDFKNLNTVLGLNAGDWLFRSRQSFSQSGDKVRFGHLYAYLQRTFTSLGATAQAGEINLANSVFSGTALNGVQLVPESTLLDDSNAGVVIEGIAHSVARVEVRQNSSVVHTAMVPAGPFSINDLKLLGSRNDLHVTVIEADGSKNSFVVPMSNLSRAGLNSTPGYSFAAGQYRDNTKGEGPAVLTASRTWAIDRRLPASAGAMLTSDYQGLGWGLGFPVGEVTDVNLSQLLSNDTKEKERGSSFTASASTRLGEHFSVSASTSQQSKGYRQLGESLNQRNRHRPTGQQDWFDDEFDEQRSHRDESRWYNNRYRDQYSLSLGLGNTPVGNFQVSQTKSYRFDGSNSQRLMGSWSKGFGRASVSLNLSKDTGSGRDDRGLQTYLSVSLPLGERTVRTYMNKDSDNTRYGANLNDRLSDTIGYSIQAEHDQERRDTDLSVTTNLLPRYAQVNLGYSRYGQDSTQYSGGMSGAVVAHAGGVTLSPYPVDDTFGVISVPGVSGAKVTTPRGPVWTDMFGQAVVSSLTPYKKSQLTVVTQDLPRNMDITNGVQDVHAGKGSVSQVKFDVVTSRRALISATDSTGKPLAKGLAVFNTKNQFLTIVIDGGNIYLPQVDGDTRLYVKLADGSRCDLDYAPGEQADLSSHYETAQATCKKP